MLDIKFKISPGHTGEREWMDPSPLKALFWNVTSACNYRCPICFTDAGRPAANEISTAEAFAIVDKIHRAKIRDVVISGGEPFMRPDLLEILSRLARCGIAVRIASNGSLLNDSVLAKLREKTLTKSFQISLDTIDPHLYAQIHEAPSDILPAILENVRRVRKSGFHTTISVRLTTLTLPGIPRLLDLACREGWPTVTVHLPLYTRRTEGAYPQDADLLSLLEPAFQHFARLPRRWLIETYIPWAEYHPVLKRLRKSLRIVHRGCRAGRDRLTITPAGFLSPCVCLDVTEAYVGHALKDDLISVFQNAPLCRLFRHPGEHGICLGCPNLEKCGGGCRAAAFALTGQMDADDGSCPVLRGGAGRKGQKPDEP